MAVILPDNYPYIHTLRANGLNVLTKNNNKNKLNIGILNIMPNAEKYEVNLFNAIGHFDDIVINPHFIKLNQHKYGSTNKKHLETFYTDFQTCSSKIKLDGLIVTGAPVEHLPYSKINYWEELKAIMMQNWKAKIPQVGLCWAGLAIAELIGINKYVLDYKLFGVFESKYKNSSINSLQEKFYCPQSRHAGISDKEMKTAEKNGQINLLAYAKESGYFIFESTDKLLLAHTGHSEYHKQRIVDEYKRDLLRGRSDVKAPANFNVESPINSWKKHRKDFFKYWLKIVQG